MRLKRVILAGFKSFRDRSVIEFGEGITAIVGPNGCGKSNVLDAIRWALGEGSVKSLRTGKMADVLFGGTEKSKGKGLAEVKILFETPGDPLKIGSSEVEIGRKLSFDGISDYTLNGKNIRLKDLHLLLHQMGLGKEGFWCFEQGKVDQAVSWSPEERRSIFEETSGISLYLSQKHEALRKLKETEGKLEILIEKEKEATKLLELLKTQAEATEKYLKIKERSHRVERELYTARLFHLEESIKYEEIRHHTLIGEKLELEGAELALREQLASQEKGEETCLEEKQHLEEKLLHLHHEIEKEKRELEAVQSRIRSLETLIGDRQHRIEKEEKSKQQIEKELQELIREGNSPSVSTLKEKLDKTLHLREEKEEELEQILLLEKQEQERRMQVLKDRHLIEQKLSQIEQGKKIQEEIKSWQEKVETLLRETEPEDPLEEIRLKEKEEKLGAIKESIRKTAEEAAKSTGRLKSIEEMIKKLPGTLQGNTKVLEWHPEWSAPLQKRFSLPKELVQKGSALLGPYFDAIVIDDETQIPTIIEKLGGLSFSFYVGKNPQATLQEWIISSKAFAPNPYLLEEEKLQIQDQIQSLMKQKEGLLEKEAVLQKELSSEKGSFLKKQEESKRKNWELEKAQGHLKTFESNTPLPPFEEEERLKKRLEELILTPLDHQGMGLKQKLDLLRKEERDLRQQLAFEEKKLEERERKRLLKERDFEEREREKLRLLTEKKELQQKLVSLPQERDNVKEGLDRSLKEQIGINSSLQKVKEVVQEYSRQIGETKKLLEATLKRLTTTRMEEDRSKNIYATLIEKKVALEGEIFESLGSKLEGKRTESSLKELEKEWKEVKLQLLEFTDISLTALERYRQESAVAELLRKDILDLDDACQEGYKWIEDLDKASTKKFLDVFHQVNRAFEEAFQNLFKGGQAHLKLSKPDEPLSSGIEIAAQPPGKAVKSVQLLSGGEKCLVGIALLIALFTVKKAPIALFDEVDAPLDEANLGRFIDLLLPFSQHTQVIQVTHQRYTMEVASSLLGVTMQERGVSKVLPLSLSGAKRGQLEEIQI